MRYARGTVCEPYTQPKRAGAVLFAVKHARISLGVFAALILGAACFLGVMHDPVGQPSPHLQPARPSPKAAPFIQRTNSAEEQVRPATTTNTARMEPTPAAAQPTAKFVLPPSARLASELSNRGNATAIEGAETYMWASINRETDVAAKLIKWVGGPDEGTWTYGSNDTFRSVPEPWQSQLKTPERLIAVMQENELERFGAFEIIRQEVSAPNLALVQVRWFASDGSFLDQSYFMRLTPMGWRREVHPATLNWVVKQLQAHGPGR